MVYSNLSLIFEVPQQSTNALPIITGVLGALFGAVATGLIKYAMGRKNKLLQAYASLIGKRDVITQAYTDFIHISLQRAVNEGLKQDAYKYAMENIQRAKEYIKQAEKIEEETDSYNDSILIKNEDYLMNQKDDFWKIIGTINSIINTEDVNELIDDIRKEKDLLEKYQQDLVKRFSNGVPDGYFKTIPYLDEKNQCIDTSSVWVYNKTPEQMNAIILDWENKMNSEIICETEKLGMKIDSLINYIRDNEVNKCWIWFGFK